MVCRVQVNNARNADQATRAYERFVYPVVKITRQYEHQTWQTFFKRNYQVRKGLWAFFLGCAFRLLIGWADKLLSHGINGKKKSSN